MYLFGRQIDIRKHRMFLFGKRIDIYSSFAENNLGKVIYKTVLDYKPMKIVEFGVLQGYATVCMALALKKLGRGKIVSYDDWQPHEPHLCGDIETVKKNLQRYKVLHLVELKTADFFQWVVNPEPFDLLFLDIDNDGRIIELAITKLQTHIQKGAVILFEGGSEQRDNLDFVIANNQAPMYPLREKLGFKVLDRRHPSISICTKDVKYSYRPGRD
ncbi:MAG: class I SAM-dependent methyltransferase [Candidatus Omnitrophica bacterium]|nr:class I SAM-dependent methyltransferase [Candidatus Omnitrophota bacterium]